LFLWRSVQLCTASRQVSRTHGTILVQANIRGTLRLSRERLRAANKCESVSNVDCHGCCFAAQGISHLQKMGVCHRDMSLENILVDDYKTSVVIDLGMCLKIPYDDTEKGGVADVSAGTLRRLVTPLVPCGKPNYISPEVLKSQDPFDGFAIDLWAAAVILFIMLVGLPPWEFARDEDPRYRMVVRGGLERMLRSWQRPVSPLVADLLQKMLREDPRERLSLCEVKDHPWVAYEEGAMNGSSVPPTVAPADEPWRT
jgi:serine/threonine protein kinase